jgi:hypothetical protein
MSYRTCKRCSVSRVNTLCDLYERAFTCEEENARRDLTKLVKLAAARGYSPGLDLLRNGHDEAAARCLCWNISSVLNDKDLEIMGYKPRRKT